MSLVVQDCHVELAEAHWIGEYLDFDLNKDRARAPVNRHSAEADERALDAASPRAIYSTHEFTRRDIRPPPPSTIGPDELRQLISEHADMMLVDVRSPEIFEKQRWYTFPSAKVIPLEQLKGRLGELPRDQLIVTACMKGFRSVTARDFLKENGFARVEVARLDEYLAKGHPVVAVERPTQSMAANDPPP